MRFSPSCGCCGPPACNEYTDSLASDAAWVEEAGNWTFDPGSGGFVTVSDSDAQLIYQDVDAAVIAVVPYAFDALVGTDVGADDYRRNRIIFNWEDVDNYWFGESIDEPSGANSIITVNLGRVVAGVEEILESAVLGPTGVSGRTINVTVCYENGIVKVHGSKSGSPSLFPSVWTNVALVAGAMYGLGTGDQTGFDTTSLDLFNLTILLDAEDHTCVDCDLPALPSCPDACEQGYAAEEYSLEVSGFSVGTCGDCSNLNGTFSLTHTTGCVWRSADITDVCGVTHQYRLEIDDTAGIQVFLEQTDPAGGDVFSWVATDDGEGTAPWHCLRWTDITLDKDTGDDVPCGTVPATVTLSAVRPF